ncbi:Ndj1p RNJ42_01803 [Nakaseomyces bracarensis]|uniref:Ndj1p n=1 Tax=Nakaseomyces bracarensis TaxID=273131 RepID=UPI003871AE5B
MGKYLEVRKYMNEYDVCFGSSRADIALFRDCNVTAGVTSYSKYISISDSADTTLVPGLSGTIDVLPSVLCIAPQDTVREYIIYLTAILFKCKGMYLKIFVNWRQLIHSYVSYQCMVLYRGWSGFNKTGPRTDIQEVCDQVLSNHLYVVSSKQYSIDTLAEELKASLCRNFIQCDIKCTMVNYCVWFDLQNGVLLFVNGELSSVIEDKDLTVHSTYGICIGHIEPEIIVHKLLLFCNLALIEFFLHNH